MAIHGDIYSSGYRTSRSPFPDDTRVWILGPNGPDRDDDVPHDAVNVVYLDPRKGLLGRPACPVFRPAVWLDAFWPDDVAGWAPRPEQFADGGRFISCGDSRFHAFIRRETGLVWSGAIPLHDYSITSEARDNAIAQAVFAEREAAKA